MKVNLNEIKNYISMALSETSRDFQMAEINFYLKTALQKIEQKQIKENKKSEFVSSNMVLKNGTLINPIDAKKAISKIDELINFEQNKINSSFIKQDKEIKTIID